MFRYFVSEMDIPNIIGDATMKSDPLSETLKVDVIRCLGRIRVICTGCKY